MRTLSVLAAVPVVTPSIADPHPDAELLALGRDFEAQWALIDRLAERCDDLRTAWDEFERSAPESLRWRWETDRGMPFWHKARYTHGELYTDEAVTEIRSRRWDNCSGTYTSGVTGAQAQARAEQIMEAFDRWRPIRDAHRATLNIDAAEDELDAAYPRLHEIESAIMKVKPTTIEGARVTGKLICETHRREIADTNLQDEHVEPAYEWALRLARDLATT